jgi:hypothetical protein
MSRDTQFAKFAELLFDELLTSGRVYIDTSNEYWRDEWKEIIAQRVYDLSQHSVGYTLEYLHECGLRTPGSMNLSIQPSIPDMTTLPEVSDPDTKQIICTACGVVYVQDTPGWYEYNTPKQVFPFCSRAHLEQWQVQRQDGKL